MPGSWEIKEARDKRILVGVIMPPDLGVSMDFAQNLTKLQLPPGSDFMRVVNLPYGPARNQAAKMALDNGYNLAFLDADMRVPPDAYINLIGTGLDIVGGLYYQRFYPYSPVLFNAAKDEKGNVNKVLPTGWKPGDLVPCDFLPCGLTFYTRRLLETMFQRHPTPFAWGVDTAPVPDYGGGQVPPFSEDFTFSWRAKQLGFQPYCHTGIVGLHETRAIIGPRWMLPLPSSDPSYGVCAAA